MPLPSGSLQNITAKRFIETARSKTRTVGLKNKQRNPRRGAVRRQVLEASSFDAGIRRWACPSPCLFADAPWRALSAGFVICRTDGLLSVEPRRGGNPANLVALPRCSGSGGAATFLIVLSTALCKSKLRLRSHSGLNRTERRKLASAISAERRSKPRRLMPLRLVFTPPLCPANDRCWHSMSFERPLPAP